MEEECFDEAIKQLGVHVGGECSEDLSCILFEEYEIFDIDRFLKACKWLSDNYEGAYNSFPNMPWFKKAMAATTKTFSNYDEYSDSRDSFGDVESYTKEEQEEAFRKVRRELIKKRIATIKEDL